MTEKEYLEKMKIHEEVFDLLWMEIVQDTNMFIRDNPDRDYNSLPQIEKFVDQLALSASWIHDRIKGIEYKGRRGSTKKMRRILGYTYP